MKAKQAEAAIALIEQEWAQIKGRYDQACHRKRQIAVRSPMNDYCRTDILITDWRPGNSTWSPDRSRCYYRPTTTSLARLERLLKSNRIKPAGFDFHLDGPDVYFEVHGSVDSPAIPEAA